jgi:hypothetical protein
MDIICDIDGTLMNVEVRRQLAVKMKGKDDKRMNWDVFLDPNNMTALDTPNWDVVEVIKKLNGDRDTIIFTSARNERHRQASLFQIEKKCLISMRISPYSEKGNRLYLRADDDFRPDDITKREIYEKIVRDGFEPELVFDDRDQVVKMWRDLGLPCYQVRAGDF